MWSPESLSPRRQILQKTHGEIRSFLDEVANGTSRYRSLHNLTEQVEHQYHGRFLLELIQNAHDALPSNPQKGRKARIEIVLVPDEGIFGTLYVANDGSPFSRSNFVALSNLGQSDKDPEKSIGNKGIGFRSVLEIARSPEVYSRVSSDSLTFDGFCFSFRSDVASRFDDPIRLLASGDGGALSPIEREVALVDWSDDRLREFSRQCGQHGDHWISRQLEYLSPYALPLLMGREDLSPCIRRFQDSGAASVIRLPIESKSALASVLAAVEQLGDETILFLDRVTSLRIETPDRVVTFRRSTAQLPLDVQGGAEVKITKDSGSEELNSSTRYWMWLRSVGGADDSDGEEEIRETVTALPGKWPSVKTATVSVAVPIETRPTSGSLSIFLPTKVPSGFSAHLNASFFGDMSRTDVSFDHPYNLLLLRVAARLVVTIVVEFLAKKGEVEARAIVDLIAPRDGVAGERWWREICFEFDTRGVKLASEEILLHQTGWGALESVSRLPNVPEPRSCTPEIIRDYASFSVLAEGLDSRADLVQEIFRSAGIKCDPLPERIAETIERIASAILNGEINVEWNDFWYDARRLLPGNPGELRERLVFLGTDGYLHSADNESFVFFRPQRLGPDDEVDELASVEVIPSSLQGLVAFLHEDIRTHTRNERNRLEPNALHRWLSQGLVTSFGVESILRNVLIPAVAELGPSAEGQTEERLADVLHWGIALVRKLLARDKGQTALPLLGRLRAPCVGGWYRIAECSFGRGWEGTKGADVEDYLLEAATTESREAANRLLLSPSDSRWGTLGSSAQDLLSSAGVIDGIRPIDIESREWKATCTSSQVDGVQLPHTPPPCFPPEYWESYREYVHKSVKPQYTGRFEYKIRSFYSVPGLDAISRFDPSMLRSLSKSILASMRHWKGGWTSVGLMKTTGEPHILRAKSPLAFALQHSRWLTDGIVEPFPPTDRWFLAPSLKRNPHDYAHLPLLPTEISTALADQDDLVVCLQRLGLPVHDGESFPTGSRLLDDLAIAQEDPKVDIANRDVFLGQVRTGWRLFRREGTARFPKKLIIREGSRDLSVCCPNEDYPVYLPDAPSAVIKGLEIQGKPVIEIAFQDARRLADGFVSAFGDGVLRASELESKPIVEGIEWSFAGGHPLRDLDLDWLGPVILTTFAYGGAQVQGTTTQTFARAMESLKELKIAWVNDLEVGLWRGDQRIASTKVPALLVERSSIVAHRANQDKYSELADVLSALVDRADLQVPLRLVLRDFDGKANPTSANIEAALGELKISADRVREVHHKWIGDLSWAIKMLRPLVTAMDSASYAERLSECASAEEVHRVLDEADLRPLSAEDAFARAQSAPGFNVLGRDLFELVGMRASMEAWNTALRSLGEKPVENVGFRDQFQDHLDAARPWFRVVIRSVIETDGVEMDFHDLDERIVSVPCPDDFLITKWEVTFGEVMRTVVTMLSDVPIPVEIINGILASVSSQDLRDRIDGLGLQPEIDPLQTQAENKNRCEEVFKLVRRLGLAWCAANQIQTGDLEDPDLQIPEGIVKQLAREGVCKEWNDADCLRLLAGCRWPSEQREFWRVIEEVHEVKNLDEALGITKDDIDAAEERLASEKQEITRRKLIVRVCGRDFENSEENLSALWDHLSSSLPDDAIDGVVLHDLTTLQSLPPTKKKRGKKTPLGGGKSRVPRLSQAMKDLLGLAGEIHAFRALKKQYGSEAVRSDSWISENSLHRFPGNPTDDGFGCDFRVHIGKKVHFIEVKATQGDRSIFELGPSEVRLAIEKADGRKHIFHILHVMEVLNETPMLRMLPNPFSRKSSNRFVFEEAGLHVRYQLD